MLQRLLPIHIFYAGLIAEQKLSELCSASLRCKWTGMKSKRARISKCSGSCSFRFSAVLRLMSTATTMSAVFSVVLSALYVPMREIR